MRVTSIRVGDIDVRVGGVICVHDSAGHPGVKDDVAMGDRGTGLDRRGREAPSWQEAADSRCERLNQEHEARVRRWEALFGR